jgi:D-psicose/D-tagatose/L-ribulose 3-epimerase
VRIGISNLAWEREHDAAVASILRNAGVDAIDVVPGRYFEDTAKVSESEVTQVRRWWSDSGFRIFGMQSLLFGTKGLNIFGSAEAQTQMLEHLAAIARVAALLGATRLTFGSPRNRDRSGWENDAAHDHAVRFFRRLAQVGRQHDVCFCLEPNPPGYQCNFMTTTEEAAAVVRAVGEPQILLQLDTGALAANAEDAAAVIPAHQDIVGHIHASEPNLAPLGSGVTDHRQYGAIIQAVLPDRMVTIEMLPGADRLAAVCKAAELALARYGSAQGAGNT